MLKFFRRVRWGLLTENKFSRYIVYAIRENGPVIIGILTARSINNWNEFNKDRKIERGVKKELITVITYRLLKPYEEKTGILKAAGVFHNRKYKITALHAIYSLIMLH